MVFLSTLLISLCSLLINSRSILAITIDSPAEGASWDLSQPSKISWSSVETDPSTFNIQIVNNNPGTYPTGFSQTLKTNVSTSDDTYTASNIQGLKVGNGFQINFVSENSAILAQSKQFNITALASSSPVSNATSVVSNTTSVTLPNSTVTATSTHATTGTHAQNAAGHLEFSTQILSIMAVVIVCVAL